MGHSRLGTIPKGRKWAQVVALVANAPESSGHSAVVSSVASSSLTAAEAGLEEATGDSGLLYSFFLLTQIALAARRDDWHEYLQRVGINLPQGPTFADLTTEVQAAIDDHIFSSGTVTDVGEFAQKALGEALTRTAGSTTQDLFAAEAGDLRASLRTFSTKKGFSELGQKFFGSFMAHFLNFYLSRITASNVGKPILRNASELTSFNAELVAHCEASARIVRDYCGEWYSKTEFKERITLDNTSRFMHVALRKLVAEVKRQKEDA